MPDEISIDNTPGESPESYAATAALAGLHVSAEHAANVAERIAARRQAEAAVRDIDTSQCEPANAFRPRRTERSY